MRAVFNGVTVADSRHVMLLIEARHLPIFYFPQADVRMDLLRPSDRVTECAYKGQATHLHARIGDRVYRNIAWIYREPITLAAPVAGMVAFYNERVDALYDDDELLAKPRTQWSE